MKERIVLQDARDEGFEQGVEQGIEQTIISLICKKLIKGKTVPEIAEAIEEPEEKVSEICKIASKYLPDYDINKIMSELEEMRG